MKMMNGKIMTCTAESLFAMPTKAQAEEVLRAIAKRWPSTEQRKPYGPLAASISRRYGK